MRAVVQRVSEATVRSDGAVVGAIGGGLLVLLGIGKDDGEAQARWMANRIVGLRIFADAEGRMNRSLLDVGGGVLAVSQFTLYGDCRKGRRPSFVDAMAPDLAGPLYERFCELLAEEGCQLVERGRFGAQMHVSLVNDGPVTLVVESP
jgi:D-tyrosyl-tRNA(Tyr) deacylase